jgi:hypothetical protein
MLSYIKAQSIAFSPEEVILLVGAFDKTWHTVLAGGVKLEGDAEPVRAMLAKRIIENASRGELNQDRLCNDALDHWAANLLSAPRPPRTPSTSAQ